MLHNTRSLIRRQISAISSTLSALLTFALLTSCANPTDSNQMRFCKALAQTQAGGVDAWDQATTRFDGAQGMEVALRFRSARDGQPWRISCQFDHNAPDDTALTLADPASAYATSPSSMQVNGQTLSRSALAEAVKQAMLDQGADLIERAKQAVR